MSEIETTSTIGNLSTVQLDVTDEKSIKEAADMDPDIRTRFQLCLETNVMGPAMVAETFRPLLLKSQNPYSIYASSGERTLLRNAAQKPSAHENGYAYQVSKAALNILALLEARDYGPKGLKLLAMSPGFVRSNLRGPSEDARNGWGKAGDPEVSGQIVLDIVQGKRDADVGCLVHKDGVYQW